MSKLAIECPYFLTWLGTYYMIEHSDVFILWDNFIFNKDRDFRSLWHRNSFELEERPSLTLPIEFKQIQEVRNIKINTGIHFKRYHLTNIERLLGHLPYASEVHEQITKPVYLAKHKYLVDFNIHMIYTVCDYLGIRTDHIKRSSKLPYRITDRNKPEQILSREKCSTMLVAEHRTETNKYFQILPLRQLLPRHFNILEILSQYGRDAINLIK